MDKLDNLWMGCANWLRYAALFSIVLQNEFLSMGSFFHLNKSKSTNP